MDKAVLRDLRKRSHGIKSKLRVGKAGLTPGVVAEISKFLEKDEILKVRLGAMERDEAAALCERIAAEAGCELVERIGQVATFWRGKSEEGAAGATDEDGGDED